MTLKEPWIISDGFLIPKKINIIKDGQKIVSPHYPVWSNRNDILVYQDIPNIIPKGENITKPHYPVWSNRNGILMYSDIPDIMTIGAFNGCYLCEEVVIPESVKLIGPYAFAGSGVTTVTIAEDCKYFPTSFPEGCHIKRY